MNPPDRPVPAACIAAQGPWPALLIRTIPDFVQYAESFGARGYRVEAAGELMSVLEEALHCGTVAVVDCPVDYAENMRLTERLAALTCPV